MEYAQLVVLPTQYLKDLFKESEAKDQKIIAQILQDRDEQVD